MGNLIRHLFIFLLLTTIYSCGQNIDWKLKNAENLLISNISYQFAGDFVDLNGIPQSLHKYSDKPTVIIFSSKFCSSCKRETEHLVESIKDQTGAPTNVNIISLLVGNNVDTSTAKWWKEKFSIPWQVGIDLNKNLLNRFCTSIVLPCVTVFTPDDGIVLRANREVPPEEIQKITGIWEFDDNDGGEGGGEGEVDDPEQGPNFGKFIKGTFISSDSNEIDFKDYKKKTVVLMFSDIFCSDCSEEIEHLLASLRDPSSPPPLVELITINVGDTTAESALELKEKYSIPWMVGADSTEELFEKYCPDWDIPCTVIQKPGRKKLFQKYGLIEAAELKNLTGPWYH